MFSFRKICKNIGVGINCLLLDGKTLKTIYILDVQNLNAYNLPFWNVVTNKICETFFQLFFIDIFKYYQI